MAAIILISVLCVLLARSNAALATSESDNRVLRSDNALQTAVITTQAFNFNRFNQIAENTNRLNSLIDAGTEKTIIEYREILRREKTCDLPVPADVAGGLAMQYLVGDAYLNGFTGQWLETAAVRHLLFPLQENTV